MMLAGTRRLCVLLGAVLLLFPGGCGGKREAVREEAPAFTGGPKVAVAPMENRSNDLDASEIVRRAFAEGVSGRGYDVMPTDESDRLLREHLGISYGGQLPTTTPAEVCKALGVEGVFYGEVQEWNKTTTGLYNSVSVVASFRFFGKDGILRWEGGDRQAKTDIPRGGGNLGGEIVGRAVLNLLMNPMTPYGKTVGRNIARKVPPGALDRAATAPEKSEEKPVPERHIEKSPEGNAGPAR